MHELRKKRIFIVDDYEESCQLLSRILSSTYECYYICDSTKTFPLLTESKPDLVILDYKMPGLMGIDICKIIRETEATKNIPIIFISGTSTVDEKIRAFECGATDFISKPFHVRELILRIKARLPEKIRDPGAELQAANLVMKILSRQVFVGTEEVPLTPKQFDILKMLVSNKNGLVTRNQFLSEIWGSAGVNSRNVDSQINYIKRKINKFQGKIIAVPSLGYRLEV